MDLLSARGSIDEALGETAPLAGAEQQPAAALWAVCFKAGHERMSARTAVFRCFLSGSNGHTAVPHRAEAMSTSSENVVP